MSQHDFVIADGSGATVLADINNAVQALANTSKGTTRPATAYAGQLWINDSATPWVLNIFDGSNDIAVGTINASTNVFYPYSSMGAAAVIQRSTFARGSTTTITLTPGVYCHRGTVDQMVSWGSALTFYAGPGGSNAASTALGASQRHYLYIDDSALSGNVIAASQLLNSTLAPTWVDAKGGWYAGNDLCIFSFTTGVGSTILPFKHSGDWVFLADAVVVASEIQPSNTGLAIDCSGAVPTFARVAEVTFIAIYLNADAWMYWASSATTGHYLTSVWSTMTRSDNSAVVDLSDTRTVIVYWSGVTTNKVTAYVDGWMLPNGM